jgi:hypothetical protein
MKYWQLQACLSNDLNLSKKYLNEIDMIEKGQDLVPENSILEAFSESKEKFIILSNGYLRSDKTSEMFLSESNNKIIEAYKKYGDIITEVFDYGSLFK